MNEDTIDTSFAEIDDTIVDEVSFAELEEADRTVLTSAAPPDDTDVSPWPHARTERRFHSMRGAVYYAVGTSRFA